MLNIILKKYPSYELYRNLMFELNSMCFNMYMHVTYPLTLIRFRGLTETVLYDHENIHVRTICIHRYPHDGLKSLFSSLMCNFYEMSSHQRCSTLCATSFSLHFIKIHCGQLNIMFCILLMLFE